ncbi:MAG: GNAT family N-acetyltransferase [Myxococcota bacterium]
MPRSSNRSEIERARRWLAEFESEEIIAEIILGRGVLPVGTDFEILEAGTEVTGVSLVLPSGLWLLHARDPRRLSSFVPQLVARRRPSKVIVPGALVDALVDALPGSTRVGRAHHQRAMVCARVQTPGEGRWATLADCDRLEGYAAAYERERRVSVRCDWAREVVPESRVAVLEIERELVSVVRRLGETEHYAMLGGTFTFVRHRGGGYGTALTAFMTQELLGLRPRVHLTVDVDNSAARSTYERVGFRDAGSTFTAYLQHDQAH